VKPITWKLMNFIFFTTLAMGWGFGYVVGDKSTTAGVAGLIFALAVFFIGATVSMLKTWIDHKSIVAHYERAMDGLRQEMVKNVEKQRILCAEAMINISKASVGRVVDRVLAEHPSFSSNVEQLEAAKEDAKVIIDQELEALEDAVAFESRQ
jgi:hypothetical protein